MSYTNHLYNLIRKSTFKIVQTDGFIDPSGEFIPCHSHHHVETALKILSDMDNMICFTKKCLRKYKRQLTIVNKLAKTDSPVDEAYPIFVKNSIWLYNSDMIDKNRVNYNKILYKIRGDIERNQKYLENAKSAVAEFEKANKNKGYDSAEFLLIKYGYIAVESGYLLYYKKNIKRTQILEYNCSVEKDDNNDCIIVPLTKEEIEEKNNKKRNSLISKASYYKNVQNRFHCPSGFPRTGYLEWERQCAAVGINANKLLYNL